MTFKAYIRTGLLALLLSTGCKDERLELRIAVANSVRPAAEALIAQCPALDENEAELVFASSGRLVAQIKDGAPFDLLMGADRKYPRSLYENGLTLGSPTVFASNIPVLQSSQKELPEGRKAIELLKELPFRTIAVASPETSPFGRMTRRILKDAGLLQELEARRVIGTGISEVDRYIRTGNAELGITSRSTAMEGKGSWVPIQGYRLEQAMVRIDRERSQEEKDRMQAFWHFVRSPEGQRILREHGHGIPEQVIKTEVDA